jgi:membrane-associated phospholipid phosphatase
MNKELETHQHQEQARGDWRQLFIRRISSRRVVILLALLASLAILLAWLPPTSRFSLYIDLFANRALVVFLLLFSLLALSLFWSLGQQIDTWFFSYVNLRGHRPLWVDRLMWLMTQVGNMGSAVVIAALSYWLGDSWFAVRLMLGVLSLWLVVEAIKALTDRSRPFKVLVGTRVIGVRERGLSFPSGHTSQAFFMVSLLIHHLEVAAPAAAILYGVAILVGLTRLYVGAHYPRDVLAGAFLGLVWGILMALVPPYL